LLELQIARSRSASRLREKDQDGRNSMSDYKLQLQGHDEVAEGTMAFRFNKPSGFTFKPGQAIELKLIDPPETDAKGANRAFSLVSAPFERELMVATRMRDSAFKRVLKSLAAGANVMLDGPFGSLTLHKNRVRAAVLIAGGIGITPFMSMLRQAAHDQLPQNLMLLYSNRRPEDAAFLAELQQLEQRNKYFRLIATMTEMQKSARTWDDARGVIDDALVKEAVSTLDAPIFYAAGPPAMVEAIKQVLSRIGIDEDDVRSEDFMGY
jgi:ferredoxin-NADP reductase